MVPKISETSPPQTPATKIPCLFLTHTHSENSKPIISLLFQRAGHKQETILYCRFVLIAWPIPVLYKCALNWWSWTCVDMQVCTINTFLEIRFAMFDVCVCFFFFFFFFTFVIQNTKAKILRLEDFRSVLKRPQTKGGNKCTMPFRKCNKT